MRHPLKILLLFIYLTPLYGKSQSIYDKLEKSIHEGSHVNFNSILTDYCKIYKPLDSTLIVTNDTLNNLYIIYQDFYKSLLQDDTLSNSKSYDYFLIPQTVKIGFVQKIKARSGSYGLYFNLAHKYFELFYGNNSSLQCNFIDLYNFRPKLSFNKPVFYLDSTLDNALNKLFFEIYDDTTISHDNLSFFDNIPQVWYGVGIFNFGSAPHLDFVLFDKKIKKAIMYYKFLGEQYVMILKKNKTDWTKVYQDTLFTY